MGGGSQRELRGHFGEERGKQERAEPRRQPAFVGLRVSFQGHKVARGPRPDVRIRRTALGEICNKYMQSSRIQNNQRSEQTPRQRRYTRGQKAYEEVLDNLCH